MKIYYKGILAIVLIIAGCTEDADKWSDTQRDVDLGGAMPYLQFTSPRIFDINDLDNSALNFTLNVGAEGKGKDYSQVNLYKSYKGGAWVLHNSYPAASIPADISISVNDALAGIDGITKDSLEGGDVFNWAFEMEFPDYVTHTFSDTVGSRLVDAGVPLEYDSVNGVYIDSYEYFDSPYGIYNVDAAATFPDFASFFATATEGYSIAGFYTMNLIRDDIGTADQTMSGYEVSAIGGTANSQYLLSDIGGTALLNLWGITVAYRIHYIGNNTFALNAGSEGWPDDLKLVGSVTRNPDTGVLFVDALYQGSCCGLDGVVIQFELVPES